MKKILLLSLLSFSLFFVQAKMFVGIDGVYSAVNSSDSGKFFSAYSGKHVYAWGISANIGSEKKFNESFGSRFFVSADYGQIIGGLPNHNIKANINVDLLFNLSGKNSFKNKLFIGVSSGYERYQFRIDTAGDFVLFGQIPLYGRAGFSFSISEKTMFDLTIKLPIVAWKVNGDGEGIFNAISCQAGFKFLF